MPVSRRTAAGLSGDVAAVYGRAEVRLLQLMAKHLEAGTETPRWVEAKLAELQTFRKRAARIVGEATAEARQVAGDATRAAYLRGMAAGQGDLQRAGLSLDVAPRHAEYATEALVRAQVEQFDGMGLRIVRNVQDDYRDAVMRAAAGTLTGAGTRLQDAQAALDDLANRGVTGFTDAAGRRWGIESYVDMATRTTTAQAAVQGHLDRLEDAGLSLVVVSNSSRECEKCRPWEGKILARDGIVDVVQTNAVTGAREHVRADGTLQQALSAGLMHPNCTHNLSGYVHGATKTGATDDNPKGYEAQQQQRAMERQVRKWHRREAVAVTPEAKRAAAAKVRGWQEALRAHVAANDLPRKPYRERFDVTPATPTGARVADLRVPLEHLDADVLEAEMGDLMARNDYGARFEQLAAELDRRDQAGAPTALPAAPDPLAEQAAMNRLLFGDTQARDLTGRQAVKVDREAELRDEYRMWLHTQWLRAEEECRGRLLTKRAEFDGIDPADLFSRKLKDLRKYASPELQEWFAQPGNQRMSFPEFRAGIMDDKAARQARGRLKSRGFESEYG